MPGKDADVGYGDGGDTADNSDEQLPGSGLGQAAATAGHAAATGRFEIPRNDAQALHSPTAQLAEPVARAAQTGVQRVEIALEPAALGRVNVRLDFTGDGRMSAFFVPKTARRWTPCARCADADPAQATPASTPAASTLACVSVNRAATAVVPPYLRPLRRRWARPWRPRDGRPESRPLPLPRPDASTSAPEPTHPFRRVLAMILDATSTPTTSAGSKATTDQNKLTGDLNRFLRMLMTQLQNQDPRSRWTRTSSPRELVQFASVEQQINQNANLEKLLTAQTDSGVGPRSATSATPLKPKATVTLQDGGADATYTLTERRRGGGRHPRCHRQNRIHPSMSTPPRGGTPSIGMA